jgi:uncharacterized OB-fold protein
MHSTSSHAKASSDVRAPAVHEGLFDEDDQGKPYLLGGRCGACARLQFPLASTCPACGSGEIEAVRLADHGTLWGWTAVTAPPPGYLGEVPYGFGVVELADGLRVITRIEEPDPSKLEFGMPMKLALVELDGSGAGGAGGAEAASPVTTYTFLPTPSPALARSKASETTQRANSPGGRSAR